MGCGRVGSRIAAELDAEGHEISVIDQDRSAFAWLPRDFRGQTVLGTGVDRDVQAQAGAAGGDGFMALANGDNRNAMAAQVALHLHGVRRVVARIFDPERAEIYEELGIRAVNPTRVIADLVRQAAFED